MWRVGAGVAAGVLALGVWVPGAAAGCDPHWPVVAYRAGPGPSAAASAPNLPVGCGVSTGYAASETTLAVASDGAIVFSPAASENTLARSIDGGTSWSLVGPTRLQRTSLWNTVDPQVVVDRRTGRLFWAHTTYTDELQTPLPDQSAASWLVPTALANAHGFQVFSSADEGVSWATADYRSEPTADWEKLSTGPPPPGSAPPNSYPDVVYLCANAPVEATGPGRVCYKSLDGGATFVSAGYVFPSATAPVGCPPLAANTGVVTSSGRLYLPQSCSGGTYLAVSANEGASYEWRAVSGAPASNGLGAVVQLAADAADDLYVLWVFNDTLQLVVSRDGGHSWSSPLTVSPPGLHHIVLPALAAGPRGAVGIAYYATSDPSAKMLSGYVSETSEALAARPLFYGGAVNDPTHPLFGNYGDADSPRPDFVGAGYDADGGFWGGLVKQLGPPDASNRVATVGWVGRLAAR